MTAEEKVKKEIGKYGWNYNRLAKMVGLHTTTFTLLFNGIFTALRFPDPEISSDAEESAAQNKRLRELWKRLGTKEKKYLISMASAVM